MRFLEARPRRRVSLPEFFRVSILVAAAIAITFPYLTGNLIGGVDARWYGYMLADYIEQVRHGRFLVTVGQGPYAWNGAVHLFRSAPVYMMVARVWDLLTLERLNPFALQHLTVVTSAVVGAVGFYAAAVQFIPARRWAATGLALLYLGTPAWLSTVLRSEAYMSYMAFAALPLVLYGNARTALIEDGRGYVPLGAGLALVWMCHPPIGFLSTLATLFIQAGLVMVRGLAHWRSLVGGAATFAILGAFYFVSMSELPPVVVTHSMRAESLQILGLALFIVSLGRIGAGPKTLGWVIGAAIGAAIVGTTSIPWLCWIGASAAVWAGFVVVFRISGRSKLERHRFPLMLLSALGGAAIAGACIGSRYMNAPALVILASNAANSVDWLRPLKGSMDRFQIFQPGFGLIAIFAACVVSLFGARPPPAKVFFGAAAALPFLYFRIPLVSNFLVGSFPQGFAFMCNLPLDLRIAPVIASVTAMGGVVWLATQTGGRPILRSTTGALLCGFVAWNAFQCIPFVRHSYVMRASPLSTEKALRSENAELDAYSYLLLPIPTYFSDGKNDPLLESRILDTDGRIRVGPAQDAEIMEARGEATIRLTTRPLPNAPSWVAIEPGITVEPGAHLLLRFDFDRSKDYNGYLLLEAEHSYREYHLPASGSERSFGVGGAHTNVLSLWNSGSTPEHYKISMATEASNTLPRDGGFFANLHVSKFDASSMPVRLESFMPYRAVVTTEKGGILETFRDWLPGYQATIDGKKTAIGDSKDFLVTVGVPPGSHEVKIRFVGTARLWLAAIVSGLGWACFVLTGVILFLRRLRGDAVRMGCYLP